MMTLLKRTMSHQQQTADNHASSSHAILSSSASRELSLSSDNPFSRKRPAKSMGGSEGKAKIQRSLSTRAKRGGSFLTTAKPLQRSKTLASTVSNNRFVFQGLCDEGSVGSNTANLWAEHVKRHESSTDARASPSQKRKTGRSSGGAAPDKASKSKSSLSLSGALWAGIAASRFKRKGRTGA